MRVLIILSLILIYSLNGALARRYTYAEINFPKGTLEDGERDWEWESFDGWYNNLGHPDWGGADMQLYRRLVPVYSDGVYFPAGEDRSNPILISDQTQKGFTGSSSQARDRRTAFFIFFGQQVVEEMLDAQRAGCSVEYLNLTVPLCHDLYDYDCNGYVFIPFPRSRYNKVTGQSPGVPREQINEITPYMDGGLFYGVTKTWADALRELSEEYRGALASLGGDLADAATLLPAINDIGLPMANPSPPANHSLYTVNRFYRLGNPRGNENPFLMTWGIFWFRVHNFFAEQLRQIYPHSIPEYVELWTDERIFNRARQFTIAMHQKVVYLDWLPLFLQRMNASVIRKYNGYSASIFPGIAHIFQSAAMRFGHTLVTPGVWRRTINPDNGNCQFGPPMSDLASRSDSQHHDGAYRGVTNFTDAMAAALRRNNPYIDNFFSPTNNATSAYIDQYESNDLFAVRTCNSYWNGPVYIKKASDIEPFLEGMASQLTEREDFIITEDLRGFVFGPLEFNRRDLMAVNILRARDHGLPDYNTARVSFGLSAITSWDQINRDYDEASTDPFVISVVENIQRARVVYNDRLDQIDIWIGGILETDRDGPGPLFTAVIFDQFERIRRADRFWFENTANGMFNQEELYWIYNTTIRDLLLFITNINGSYIQENPFIFSPRPEHCPQPYQLSQLYMDQCLPQGETGANYDYGSLRFGFAQSFDYYYSNNQHLLSVASHPLAFFLIFLYFLLVITVLMVLAMVNQRRRLVVVREHATRAKTVKGKGETIVIDGDDVIITELCGDPQSGKDRSVKCSLDVKSKTINLFIGPTFLRKIDLSSQEGTIQLIKALRLPVLVCKFSCGYDLALKMDTEDVYLEVANRFRAFFDDIGIKYDQADQSNRELMKNLYTYLIRQKDIEAFFKAVFREQEAGTSSGPGPSERVNNLQLNREEFAAVLGLKVDSGFVQNMFNLADADNSGTISFREFLEIFLAFHNGTAEKKLQLMFNMYDTNHDGTLDREEFKNMLKSMMDLVRADVAGEKLEQVVDGMFREAGLDSRDEGSLSLQDFVRIMDKHKMDLEGASIGLKGVGTAPPPKREAAKPDDDAIKIAEPQAAAEPGLTESIGQNRYSRARKTVHQAYRSRTTYGGAQPQTAASEDEPDTRGQQDEMPKKPHFVVKWLKSGIRYIENYKAQIFWTILFYWVSIWIFVERAYYFAQEREHISLRRITGFGVAITRGAASLQMFQYSLLLITMARNIITFLRSTYLNRIIPFDYYITFHKVVALTAVISTLIHAIGHGFNFYSIATQNPNDLSCFFRDYFHRTHVLIKFSYWLWETITGLAAVGLVLQMTVLYVFATQYARRYVYLAFWLTHNTYVIWYILMFLHGMGRLVQDPLFGNFFIGPALIFVFDKMISSSRRKVELAVVKVDVLPSLVTGVFLKKPPGLEYKSGQWARIAMSAKGFYGDEYHSFTISSAPHEEFLSFHIRSVGPWTYNLRDYFQRVTEAQTVLPRMYMEGPWGEGHQEWFRFKVSILVGGGIGVTPFASILKDIVHRTKSGYSIACEKVIFIWVTRTQKQWEWFTDIIKQAEDADEKGILENHIYITAFFDKFDLRTTMLYVVERDFQRLAGQSLFTGLRAVTHFGRPKMVEFFDAIANDYLDTPEIGVFSCGPPGMTKSVEQACSASNRFEGPAFLHHYENF